MIRRNSNLYVFNMIKDLRSQLPDNTDPESITLEDCEKLLENEDRIDRRVKDFSDAGIYIWEFGPGSAYVVDRRTDMLARTPTDRDPGNLSLLECRKILAEAAE